MGAITLRFTSKMAQARVEGLEQGFKQGLEEVAEWDRRRRDAEARGEEFTEPPPTRPKSPSERFL